MITVRMRFPLPVYRYVLTFMLGVLVGIYAFSDENASKSRTEIKSELTEWKETLRYGIDSQVIEILDKMRTNKDDRLSNEIYGIFSITRNVKVIESSLRFFIEMNNPKAEAKALELLDSYEVQPVSVLQSCIEYLGKIKSSSLAEKAVPLIHNKNKGVASSAIRAIGMTGDNSHIDTLISVLDEEDLDMNLKGDAILALGDLKADQAVEKLTEILNDTGNESILRRYACVSLGKIGKPESLDVLINAYSNSDAQKDTFLRTYALSGVSEYSNEIVVNFLIDALRDSFWRVRLAAIQGLAKRKAGSAVEVLIYKARMDPELPVKKEAMKALSDIGTDEAVKYLVEIMSNKKTGTVEREHVVSLLVEHHFNNAKESINTIIDEEWGKKDSRILDIIAKSISQKKESGLEKYFERFLGHPAITLKIYGIRGIEKNSLTVFKDRIVEMSGESNSSGVRKAALSALESL